MIHIGDSEQKWFRSKLEAVLSKLVVEGQDYAILDFPDHANVGDSAIYLGELSLLNSIHKLAPSYVCSIRSYHQDLSLSRLDGPIYLHGGGNFGDLWPAHQSFRESILETYPDKKIIQLPQSIHFSSPQALERSARIIDRHPDFTLLVRDQESYMTAKEKFSCAVLLCPDAAHAMGQLERSRKVHRPVLCLMRTDSESGLTADQLTEVANYGPIEDWVNDTPNMKSRLDRIMEKTVKKIPQTRSIFRPVLSRVYEKWATERVNRGIAQLSSAEFIVTDRLHVHILCTLLRIPHIVFDNNYGKISRYIDAWPKDDFTTVVRSMNDFRNAMSERQIASGLGLIANK